MKTLYLAYDKNDAGWRTNVIELICDLIRFLGAEVDRRRPAHWYAEAPLPVKNCLANCEVYAFRVSDALAAALNGNDQPQPLRPVSPVEERPRLERPPLRIGRALAARRPQQ